MEIINPSGKKIMRFTTEWLGRELTIEVNRVGFRATSAVLVTYGDTVVLGTVVVGTKPVVLDYFPLQIVYEEKFYAAGKISGSKFIKREGKPSDEAVLVGRVPAGYPGGDHGAVDGPEFSAGLRGDDCGECGSHERRGAV